MPKTARQRLSLRTAVGECLPRLRILSLDLDSYGNPDNAAVLREIIATLETAYPARPEAAGSAFVVAESFIIPRNEVARLLSCAFVRFEVAEFLKPPAFPFRACSAGVLPNIDYPLNEGGALLLQRTSVRSDLLRLDLDSIASGLNVIAVECPRHLADLLNGRGDSITGDAFLQCCLYGEVMY